MPFNPKYNKLSSDRQNHQHLEFTPSTTITPKWQDYLCCRDCKQSIVESIGLFFLTRKVTFERKPTVSTVRMLFRIK